MIFGYFYFWEDKIFLGEKQIADKLLLIKLISKRTRSSKIYPAELRTHCLGSLGLTEIGMVPTMIPQ